ncbi:unnamed protein product [Prunus armeniaca]|uniref:Uncharacterized protein n=1 Tax=Prunus armeniaca TaxID=36596 RepID=A0A6J5Y3Y1_PRUAR|nr:unnamed protein product [Prunus armeniaca]
MEGVSSKSSAPLFEGPAAKEDDEEPPGAVLKVGKLKLIQRLVSENINKIKVEKHPSCCCCSNQENQALLFEMKQKLSKTNSKANAAANNNIPDLNLSSSSTQNPSSSSN